jgi:DNA-directed RNA polymerase beta subunit
MIQYKSLTQYTRVTNGVRFPQTPDTPFLLVYFSENSSLVEDYIKLNIRRQDARHVVVPRTRIPLTRLTTDIRKLYKMNGLLSYDQNMNFPKDKNIFYDTTIFTNTIDNVYKPTTYRQRAGSLIQNLLMTTFQSFPDNYKKVLIYSIDITKPVNTFPNRKSFPLLRYLRSEEIYFDDLLLLIIDEEQVRYRKLIKEKNYNFSRVIQYFRNIKMINTEEEQAEEVDQATMKVMKIVSTDLEKPSVIKGAIQSFISKDSKKTEELQNDELTDEDMHRLTIASILYASSADLDKAKRLASQIPKQNLLKATKNIAKQYQDILLDKQKSIDLSEYINIQSQDIPSRVGNKTPEHLFQKRKIDFDTNLKGDMTNAFKVLENRDIPLKFESITIKDKPQKLGELQKSDEATVAITLKDGHNNVHNVAISIPRIDPDTGTFRVNGQRKCLINQIILNPISFPKEYDSKFESSYSSFHIYSKRTKRLSYLECYMGSFKLPFLVLLGFSFGFDETLKQYGITYKIVEDLPKAEQYFTKVPSSYLVFENVNTKLKQELVASFINAKVSSYKMDEGKTFLSRDYFSDLIMKMTGRVDATYLISNNIQNIVDPVVKQILINKQLPFQLPLIMQYMASKCVTGFVQDRNDLTNQRIRNSEILVHLAQKQLLKAYTEYREQYLSGNVDAKLNIPDGVVLSQFTNLEIVQTMEYANPLEEMATITKVSPVGKHVGGIPDKQAVQLDARNVHPSYFGNIDPVDTAEGSNIGITQQLTVNAYITSARGLFGNKPLDNNERSGILSTSASMVPFIQNNEGARIIMSCNQAKQMLPLKNPEPPVIQSGYESLLTNNLSDAFIKRSPCTGRILDITDQFIEILCPKGSKQRVDITPAQLTSGVGKNTLSTFKPIVKSGQNVKEKQIIAEGASISKGTISLGRNLSCTYMPYKGYNFEDGLVINERLVKEEKLTSLHGLDIVVDIDPTDKVTFITELGKSTIKGEPIFRKYPGDIGELLGFQEEDNEDMDTHDGQIIIKSPGGRVVDIDVFCNVNPENFPLLKKLIERTDRKSKKPKNEKYTNRSITIKGISIIFKIEQELTIGLGDKLCNRYGNKGIISLIEKDELMPRTPWGERVDIIMNPLGVIGRMNMGQIYEMYCGLISKYMANQISKGMNQTQAVELFRVVMTGLDTTPNGKFSTNYINNLKKLSSSQYNEMVSQIKQFGFVPMIMPPFDSPTYKHILPVLKKLKLQTAYNLRLPEFNTNTKAAVPFGYIYVSKLEHIGEAKAHARSTGPMVGKIGQPTGGKSREGGQRVGEGDTWALASYNCPKLLSELFGPMSDDVVTKNEILTDIIQTGQAEFRDSKASPTRDLVKAYFASLMLGG